MTKRTGLAVIATLSSLLGVAVMNYDLSTGLDPASRNFSGTAEEERESEIQVQAIPVPMPQSSTAPRASLVRDVTYTEPQGQGPLERDYRGIDFSCYQELDLLACRVAEEADSSSYWRARCHGFEDLPAMLVPSCPEEEQDTGLYFEEPTEDTAIIIPNLGIGPLELGCTLSKNGEEVCFLYSPRVVKILDLELK